MFEYNFIYWLRMSPHKHRTAPVSPHLPNVHHNLQCCLKHCFSSFEGCVFCNRGMTMLKLEAVQVFSPSLFVWYHGSLIKSGYTCSEGSLNGDHWAAVPSNSNRKTAIAELSFEVFGADSKQRGDGMRLLLGLNYCWQEHFVPSPVA